MTKPGRIGERERPAAGGPGIEPALLEVWKPNRRRRTVEHGRTLRVPAARASSWSGASTSSSTIEYLDIPIGKHQRAPRASRSSPPQTDA